MSGNWMTVTEFAREAHVPTRTVYRWNCFDLGPTPYRIGRRVLYKRADVEAWFEDHAVRREVNGLSRSSTLSRQPPIKTSKPSTKRKSASAVAPAEAVIEPEPFAKTQDDRREL